MASSGALTVGIAHEIKNPLNFVNNFADALDRIARPSSNRARTEHRLEHGLQEIITDLTANLRRIRDHGERADGIVRGMLRTRAAPASVNRRT